MPRQELADIAAGRLTDTQLAENFGDVSPPLDRQAALVAAQRCLYCYDAPCINACPTAIDIPGFIRAITTDNLRGAALEILREHLRRYLFTRLPDRNPVRGQLRAQPAR